MKALRILLAGPLVFLSCFSVDAEDSSPAPQASASPASGQITEQTAEATPTPTPSLDEPLLMAVSEGNLSEVRHLLDAGANPNAAIPHPASDYWKKKYFETKLDFYVLEETNFTALMLACAEKKADIANLLLDYGANPLLKTKKDKAFALQMAARNKDIPLMKRLMGITPDSEAGKSWIRVDLNNQTASLWKDKKLILVSKISSGQSGRTTPLGEYVVTDKERTWKSTIFKVPMPYYLRLSCADFGLHQGYVPDHPASHGCIRLPEEDARKFFQQTPVGTAVSIQ
ncbi:MAG: L,D-transpeptidase family protein [Chthoniobacterales bacterium]